MRGGAGHRGCVLPVTRVELGVRLGNISVVPRRRITLLQCLFPSENSAQSNVSEMNWQKDGANQNKESILLCFDVRLKAYI